jgi:hypothetical protein
MKLNSIGSVTPVRKEVAASEQHAARRLAPLRLGGVIHGQARGGQAEHHHREIAAHEGARIGIAGKEAAQIARGAMIIAQNKPCDVVENMVQPRHQQQAVERAVDKEPDTAAGQSGTAEQIDAMVDGAEAGPTKPARATPQKPATMGTKRRPPKKAR